MGILGPVVQTFMLTMIAGREANLPHQDGRTDADRFSYALFIDSSLDNILHKTYEEHTQGLY